MRNGYWTLYTVSDSTCIPSHLLSSIVGMYNCDFISLGTYLLLALQTQHSAGICLRHEFCLNDLCHLTVWNNGVYSSNYITIRPLFKAPHGHPISVQIPVCRSPSAAMSGGRLLSLHRSAPRGHAFQDFAASRKVHHFC